MGPHAAPALRLGVEPPRRARELLTEDRPILCLVTGAAADRADWPEAIASAVAAGADWVQVRDRSLEARELLAFTEAILGAARAGAAKRAGEVRVLVNRRADVALAAGADGVHLGFDGLPAEPARRLGEDLGSAGWRVGVSTHSSEEVDEAARSGADYVHLAPIFDPLSKARERPALGPGALAEAAAASGRVRLIAQGGIGPETVSAALAAGATGVAVTGAVFSATHPGEATARLRAALDA